jgi:hypothetical protein
MTIQEFQLNLIEILLRSEPVRRGCHPVSRLIFDQTPIRFQRARIARERGASQVLFLISVP